MDRRIVRVGPDPAVLVRVAERGLAAAAPRNEVSRHRLAHAAAVVRLEGPVPAREARSSTRARTGRARLPVGGHGLAGTARERLARGARRVEAIAILIVGTGSRAAE